MKGRNKSQKLGNTEDKSLEIRKTKFCDDPG
jgi:hypothetical protein